MAKIYISSIAAVAKNDVIGKDNALLWHIPEDLKHFKKTTSGKPILMGRNTYESLGKPLPNRPNIVISRSYKSIKSGDATQVYKSLELREVVPPNKISEGPFLYASIEEGVKAAKDIALKMNADEIMIIGGGEIYKQTMKIADRLYITLIDKEYEGDTFFPAFNWNEWRIVSEDKRDGDPAFTFYILERK